MDIWVVFTLVGMNNFTGNTQANVFVWICVFISLEDVSELNHMVTIYSLF